MLKVSMKIKFYYFLILISTLFYSQKNKVVDFSNIKYVEGIAYFDNGKIVDGALDKRRTFGPYYEGLDNTFIFKEGILISTISYFIDIPENIISKQVYYFPNSSQISKMIVFGNKKHSSEKIYEFYENRKKKAIETLKNGVVIFKKDYEN